MAGIPQLHWNSRHHTGDATSFIDHWRTCMGMVTNLPPPSEWHCLVLYRGKGKVQMQNAGGRASELSGENT